MLLKRKTLRDIIEESKNNHVLDILIDEDLRLINKKDNASSKKK